MLKKRIHKLSFTPDFNFSLIGIASITDQAPDFGSIYGSWRENEVWYAYPAGAGNMVGGSRVIVISKRTGKILSDGIVGE